MNIIEFVKTHKNNLTYEQLNEFIKNNPNNLNYVDNTNKNVLMYALLYFYNVEIIELLLKNGVIIDSYELLYNINILKYVNINANVIKLLINYGFNLHNLFLYNNDLVHMLNYNNLMFYINNGANLNVNKTLLCNIFELAKFIIDKYECVKILIKNNIDINNINNVNNINNINNIDDNKYYDHLIFNKKLYAIHHHPINYLHSVLYKNNKILNLLIDNGLDLNINKNIIDSKYILNIYSKEKRIILEKYYFKYRKFI